MKAALVCLFEGKKITIDEALSLRENTNRRLLFTCTYCKAPLRAHRAGKGNHPAHFEHFKRNYDCPHSEGSDIEKTFGINDKQAIEGYEQDKKILASKRNRSLAEECKFRDNFKCQACGFKLRVNGKFVIECHHKNPLAGGGERTTALIDLISLCPTCHRIAHTRKKPLEIEEIKTVLKQVR